jgi:sec-independent protein translocase protein TatB
MFGLGWGEMVVIGIVALIAIGPKELPTVLRTIGQWMGKVRRMANEFQGQFQEALREVELSDLKKHADDIAADVANFDPMKDTRQEMEKAFAFDDPLKDINTSLEAKPATPALESADAPPAPQPGGLTDGEKLPAAALPPVDVPLPELPTSVTEKDFAPAPPQPQTAQTETPAKSGTGT